MTTVTPTPPEALSSWMPPAAPLPMRLQVLEADVLPPASALPALPIRG